MRSLVDLLTPPEGTCEIPRRAGIDLGSRELDTGASTRPRDFAWGEAEEPEPEPEPLTPDSFNKNTKAEPPTFLRPGLFIGSISAERDLQVLRKYGITHVLQVGISLRPRHASSLVYAQMKCPDSRNFDVFHAMIQSGALQFVEQGRKAGGVLVHCAAGRSRSATVVAAHLMQDEHLSAEEAIEDIRQRWWICPNIGFRQQLELFHKLGGDLSCWPQPESSSWPKRMIRSRPVTPPPQRASVPPQTPPQTPAQSPQRRVQQLQPQPVQVLSPVQTTTPANSPAKTAASAQPPPPLVQVLAPVLAEQPVSKPLPAQKPVQPTRPVQPQTPVKAPAQPRKPHSAWMAFADLDGTYAVKPKLELSGFQTMSAPTSRGVSRDSSPAPRAAAAPPAVAAGDPRRPAGQRARGPSPEPGPRRSPHEARHSSPARASVTYRAVSAPRHSRPAADGPFKSVFVPPSMWRGQDGWDLRAALQSAGLSAERAPSDWGRRFSFSDSPQPPKAAVVRAY